MIPTKNGGPRLARVLEALQRQQSTQPYELVAIDSGSTDGTLDVLRRYAIRLAQIDPADFGHGKTRNQLARMARGTLLISLSQDALPTSHDWLTRLIEPFNNPRVAATFGRQIARPGARPMQRFYLQQWYPDLPRNRVTTGPTASMTRSLFFSNVNAAFRREVWEQIPFDEALIMSEDQAWAREMLAAAFDL